MMSVDNNWSTYHWLRVETQNMLLFLFIKLYNDSNIYIGRKDWKEIDENIFCQISQNLYNRCLKDTHCTYINIINW